MTLWTKRAQKDCDQLPEKLQQRADEVIGHLAADTMAGTELKGQLDGTWSARLGRSIRILYRIEDQGLIILTIVPRRDAYR